MRLWHSGVKLTSITDLFASIPVGYDLLPSFRGIVNVFKLVVFSCWLHRSRIIHLCELHEERGFAVVVQSILGPDAALVAWTITERVAVFV